MGDESGGGGNLVRVSAIKLDIGPHRNQILLRGRHRGARLSLPPDLHRIESAGSR